MPAMLRSEYPLANKGYARHDYLGIAAKFMAIRDQHHANVSKQTMLLDGVNVGPSKWRVCGCGFNRSVHDGMNDISNIKVH